MKRLNIYGVRYCDIVLYLARVLTNMDKRVLVCDRSVSKGMRYFLPEFEGIDLNREIYEYDGFGYTYNTRLTDIDGVNTVSGNTQRYYFHDESRMVAETAWSDMKKNCGWEAAKGPGQGSTADAESLKKCVMEEAQKDAFDVVIVLNDASAAAGDLWDEVMKEKSVRLFVTDEFPESIYEMRNAVTAINKASRLIKELYEDDERIHRNTFPDGRSYFVVRDYTGSVEGIIDELLVAAGAARNFLIPYYDRDRHLEILAAYKDDFKFVGASDGLLSLVESLCGELGVRPYGRLFRTAYNDARKGVNYRHENVRMESMSAGRS